jgi:hypothetical protein
MANRVFRAPIDRQFQTVNLPVTGALLPATWVENTGSALVQLTTAVDKLPMILANVEFKDQTIADAYTSGDTGVAIYVQPNDVVVSAMAAATYAKGDPLTIAASGRLAAAATGNPIVAFYDGVAGAVSAGDLVDVIVANSSAAA